MHQDENTGLWVDANGNPVRIERPVQAQDVEARLMWHTILNRVP